MQPQSQFKNYLVFFVAFVLIFVGFNALRNWLYPPPQRLTPDQKVALMEFARAATPVGDSGLIDAVALAGRTVASPSAQMELAIAVKATRPKDEVAKAVDTAKPPTDVKPIDFGGDDFYIRAKLTPYGAGVYSVTLPAFEGATRMGLPELDANGQPKPIELIPPSDEPSFVLYHYARTDEDEKQPVHTLGRRVWTVAKTEVNAESHVVAFTTDLPEIGVRLTKTFTLKKAEYHIGLSIKIERLAGSKDSTGFRYQLAGGHGLPIEGEWYTTTYRNGLTCWVDKGNAVTRVLDDARLVGTQSGGDRLRREDKRIQYSAVAIQYFASAIVVDDQQQNQNFIEFARTTVEGVPNPTKPFLDDITVRIISEIVDPKPGDPVEHKYLLYHGPVKVRLLHQLKGAVAPELVDRYEKTLHLNTLTDYGRFGFWTDAIVFFTNLVHGLIGVLRYIVPAIHGRDAICIILVTVIVRGFMFPLSRKQAATMAKTQEQMAKVAPEIKKLKEKYKNDAASLQQAQMELYRRHGINPAAGLGGCLMLFAQMPIFMGLYFALQESFFFRLQPFLWVRNLAAPDMLIWWSENIPWLSRPEDLGGFLYLGPYFNLLPVIAVVLMGIQQKLTMPPPVDEQGEINAKTMKYMLIVFGLMFYKVPAGLCLYFIASTTWGLIERKLIKKKKPNQPDEGAAVANGKPGPRGGKGKPKLDEPPSRMRELWEKLLKEASKK
ncbi:MAG: membrane protein insertase YidC [Gemmataceae bacterium]